MLYWLSRIEGLALAAASRAVPAPLERLDHRLLLTRPYLWRSRLALVIWFSVPISLVAAAMSFGRDMDAAQALLDTELAAALLFPTYFVVLAIFYWVRIVMRFPVGPLRIGARLRAMLFNFAAIALIVAPACIYYLGLSYRIAYSIPDDEFQEEIEYHRGHAFGGCSPALSAISDSERERLEASLKRFGVPFNKPLGLWGCRQAAAYAPWPLSLPDTEHDCMSVECVEVPPSDQEGLRDRLASISAHKAAWAHYEWDIVGGLFRQSSHIVLMLALLAVIAGAIPLLGRPARPLRGGSIWARIRARKTRQAAPPPVLLPPRQPRRAGLPGIDRHLLLRHPVFWSTRGHSFLVGGLAAVAVAIASWLFGLGQPAYYALLGFCIVSAVIWVISSRRYRTVPIDTPQIKSLLKGYLVGGAALGLAGTMVPLPLIDLFSEEAYSFLLSGGLAMLIVQLAIACRLLFDLTEGGTKFVLPVAMFPVLLTATSVVLLDFWVLPALVVVAMGAILLIDLKLKYVSAIGSRSVALAMLVLMPYIPIGLWLLIAYVLGEFVELPREGAWAVVLATGMYLSLMFSTFYWGLIPTVRVLSRARYQPEAR